MCHFAKIHPWSHSTLVIHLPRPNMAPSDRAAFWKTTGIQQLCQSVRSLQGENRKGGNPDSEVTSVTRFGRLIFFVRCPSGIKVACWIIQEFSNLRSSCAHSLEESGTQWHGISPFFNTPVRFGFLITSHVTAHLQHYGFGAVLFQDVMGTMTLGTGRSKVELSY